MIPAVEWAEPVTLTVVVAYFGVQWVWFRATFADFLSKYAILAPAAWIGENTVIRAYDFYHYSSGWNLVIDQTPLLVVLIWPIVVLSAAKLASHLRRVWRLPLVVWTGLLVVGDAALMEAVATASGLWTWTVPGPFGVPLMGVWGWGCFAVASVWMLQRVAPNRETASWADRIVFVGGTVALTHGLLLGCWWIFFRWITNYPTDLVVGLATLTGGLFASLHIWRQGPRIAFPTAELWARAAAAGYFAALVFVYHRTEIPLVVFFIGFAPPYLALFHQSRGKNYGKLATTMMQSP